MEPSAKPNVMLTTRDAAVLLSLHDHCVMTFSQIARRHFQNASKPTVINRLSKLELAGFIRRERIPRMALGLDKSAIGVVYQVTRDGILELRRRISGREFKPQPVKIHHYTLHHDLILVDLAAALEVRFGKVDIINGKLLSSIGQSPEGLEPDMVVTLPGLERIAIELELSGKSEKRYREIVLHYRLSKDYARVIYFIDDPFIQSLLTRVILNRVPHPKEKPQTGKFYFSSVTDFLNQPESTPITNGVEALEKGGAP